MKRLVIILVMFFLVLTNAEANANGFGSNSQNRHLMGRGMVNQRINSQKMAYRTIVRASNNIYMAKAVANYVKNGKLLFRDAKQYYQKANKLYNKKLYRKAAHYATASLCLSSAVIHIYKADNLIALPKQP